MSLFIAGNKKAIVVIAVLTLIVSAAAFMSGCGETPKIKVGVGEKIITPPVGSPMSGYRRTSVSTGVHDDLWARSMVIEDRNGVSVVFMTLGIINLSVQQMNDIRTGVSAATGIPKDHVIISCTHTHSGPAVGGCSDEYKKLLIDNSVASAVDAWNSRVPGRVGFGSTVELGLGMNDRKMEYGGLHPDPEVAVFKAEDAKGNLIGVAFNYGCHPSTLDLHNLEFTEDWPYYSIKGIKEMIGEDVWVAYYQSAQGNVKVGYTAELSAVGADMGIRNFWYAEHKGNMMTWTVLEALGGIATSGDFTIDVTNDETVFPLRDSYHMSAKEAEKILNDARAKLAEAEKIKDTIGTRVLDRAKVDVFVTELQYGCAKWVEDNPNPNPITMYRQAVRIGDTVFVTFPVEVYAEIGLEVKNKSPFDKTFVIGLASGHGGYMPTDAEYLEGGYSAVMTRYGEECPKILVDSSLDLISKITDK